MSGKPVATGSVLTMGFAALLAGAVVVPVTGAAAGDTPAVQRNPDDKRARRVCRTIMPTGSRLSTRVCRTQAEWDDEMQKTQDDLQERSLDQMRNGDPNAR